MEQNNLAQLASQPNLNRLKNNKPKQNKRPNKKPGVYRYVDQYGKQVVKRQPKINSGLMESQWTKELSAESITSMRKNLLSNYRRSLLVPEFATDAKVPARIALPTNSSHVKSTIKFQTNAQGNAAVLVNPWFLAETNVNRTWVLINNSPALDLNGTGAAAFTAIPNSLNQKMTPAAASAYRLVSASIHIYPEMSINTAQGYIAGGIVTRATQTEFYTNGTTAISVFNNNAAIASAIDQAMYYEKAQIGSQSGIRAIYVPFDPTFEMFLGLNNGRESAMPTCDSFYWNYYITGTQATANMVMEIYYNFELEPAAGGILSIMTTKHTVPEKAEDALDMLAQNPSLMTQSATDLLTVAAKIDNALINNKPLSLLDKTINFAANHSSEILNVLRGVATLL
jgi:hypothetical protein